jgi:hypothetical protein
MGAEPQNLFCPDSRGIVDGASVQPPHTAVVGVIDGF